MLKWSHNTCLVDEFKRLQGEWEHARQWLQLVVLLWLDLLAGWITRSWAYRGVHCLGAGSRSLGDKRGGRSWQQEGPPPGSIPRLRLSRQNHSHLGRERRPVPAHAEWPWQLGAWPGIPSGRQVPGLGQRWQDHPCLGFAQQAMHEDAIRASAFLHLHRWVLGKRFTPENPYSNCATTFSLQIFTKRIRTSLAVA